MSIQLPLQRGYIRPAGIYKVGFYIVLHFFYVAQPVDSFHILEASSSRVCRSIHQLFAGMSVDHVPSDQLNKEKNNVPITQTSLGSDGGIQVRADDEVTQRSLKTIGSIILIPQPSDDPKDPLNWTWGKKHLVLLSLFLPALLSDFGMTWGHYAIKTTSDYYNLTSTGTTLFQVQAPTFRMSIPHVAQSISGGIFLQGPGGVFAVPFAQRYGRYVKLAVTPASVSETACDPSHSGNHCANTE